MGEVIGVCHGIFSPRTGMRAGSGIILWLGVDTHREMHYAEVQDEKRNVLWHGRIPVSRDGFLQLLEKIRTIEKSNSQKIAAVYMNPTGNLHNE